MVASLAVKKRTIRHEESPSPSVSSETSSISSQGGKRKSSDMEDSGVDREKKRKLMNRVAAQQSRDRKRLYMDNLEKEIKKLKSENATLKSTNLTIQEEKDKLLRENMSLKCQSVVVKEENTPAVPEISSSVTTLESAAFINGPLPQEQVTALGMIFWLLHFLQILQPTTSQMTSLVSSKKFGKISVEELIQRHLSNNIQRCSAKKSTWWGPHQQSWNPCKNSFNLDRRLLSPLPS